MKKLSIILLLIFCTYTYAQDKQDINPIRIGLKIGTPNIIGGNLEFVTKGDSNTIIVYQKN